MLNEVEAFSVLARAAAAIKHGIDQLQVANRSEHDRDATVKAAVLAVHKTLTQSKNIFLHPPKMNEESVFFQQARRIMTLGQQWCSIDATKKGGFEGVLQKYTSMVMETEINGLKARAETLENISGGGSEEGTCWKEGLKSNSSWAKVSEAFKGILAQCDALSLETQLESLKEDASQ